MAEIFKREFPFRVTAFNQEETDVKYYTCNLEVTPVTDLDNPNMSQPLIHRGHLDTITDQVVKILSLLRVIEMSNVKLKDLVEPKNGFNKTAYLADLRTMPLGYSKIIGDERPQNTLDGLILLVTNGYFIDMEILEIEIESTFKDKARSYPVHPFKVSVTLT